MKRRVVATAGAVLAVGALASASADAAKAPSTKAPKKATVKAVNFAFKPSTVKIRKGGKVTWKFVQGRHNVKGKGWKSPTKNSGKYTRKFKQTGKFSYRCTLHPGMDGTVKVKRR